MRPASLLAGSLLVVAAASLFGTLGPLSRFAYEAGLTPVPYVAWRAIFGTLIVVLFVAWRLSRGSRLVSPRELDRPARISLAIAAITSITLNTAMFIAFGLTAIAIALLAFYTYPALVAVVEIARGRERLDGPKIVALLLALAGMVLVVGGGLAAAGDVRFDPLGVLLALSAAVSQTVFISLTGDGYRSMPTDQAAGWIMAVTAVACVSLSLLIGAGGDLLEPLTRLDALVLVAVSGILAAGIPTMLFMTGIRTIGGTRTGILMLFEPVVGILLAAALLDEQLTPVQLAGGVAILVAAAVLQRSSEPIRAPDEPLVPAGAPLPDAEPT